MEREAPSWAPGDHPHTTRRGRTLRSSPHHQPGGRWLESLAMLADPRSCRVPGLGGSAPFARPHPWLLRCIAQGGWASPPTPAQNGCIAHALLGPVQHLPPPDPPGPPHVVRSTPSTHMGGPGGAPPAEGASRLRPVWAYRPPSGPPGTAPCGPVDPVDPHGGSGGCPPGRGWCMGYAAANITGRGVTPGHPHPTPRGLGGTPPQTPPGTPPPGHPRDTPRDKNPAPRAHFFGYLITLPVGTKMGQIFGTKIRPGTDSVGQKWVRTAGTGLR